MYWKRSFAGMLLLTLLTINAFSQNVAINADGSKPNKNAMLDIQSANKGLLIPRMTTDARLKIENTQGLMVYDVNTNSFWYNDGKIWKNMNIAEALAATGPWNVTGNAGTDNTNFLGTTDNVALNIRVNNQQSGRIDNTRANTFWGFRSGFNITTGNDNTGIGASAMFTNTTGYNNTAVGSNALQSNTDGYHNVALGRFALMSNTSGYANTAAGTGALFSNMFGIDNTAVGSNALYSTESSGGNTAVGSLALYSSSFGGGNTAVGSRALYSSTDAYRNTAIGVESMMHTTSGIRNTAVGTESMYSNTTGHNNTAVGSTALYQNTFGTYNVAVGDASLFTNVEGYANAASGADALHYNTTGYMNSAFGYAAMYFNNDGYRNTAVGVSALANNLSGTDNTGVGYQALWGSRGNYNVAIGSQANVSDESITNATALGAFTIVDASNKVRIGNIGVTVVEGPVPYTTPSDGRFKFNVKEDVKGLDFVMQLRPVTYHFDARSFDPKLGNAISSIIYDEATRIRRTGFIAQEVEQAAIRSGYDFSGVIKPKTATEHYSLSYESFVVPLVKAVQEQQQEIDALKKKLDKMEKALQPLITDQNNKK